MNQKITAAEYTPGYYGKKRPGASEWLENNIKDWQQKKKESRLAVQKTAPSICFSREIGVGALEIADEVSRILNMPVADREIIELMAEDTGLAKEIIEFYDERYPGRTSELFSMLISDRTFIKSDYFRHLVETVNTLAAMAATIFVGRGTHLILPRENCLSVRLICSEKFRIERLAKLMGSSVADVEKKIRIIDAEQHDFFKRVYNRKTTAKNEFDLVINRDYFKDAKTVARIISCAFEQKFKTA